ncbi:MAG: tetratricopeptide repeat protein [Vicinamibacterales bacterium]
MPRIVALTSSSPRNESPAEPNRRAATAFVRVVVAASAGVLASASPLLAADREHQQLMADLRMLQEQTLQLQVTLNSLTDALKAMTVRIDDQTNVNRKAFADQRVQIDSLDSDVRIIREKLDDNNVRVSSLTQEVEALRTSLATPPVPPPLPDDGTGVPVDPLAPALPAAPPSTAGLSPQRMWDSAFADYTSGQWTLAVLGFEQYLKAFPRSEQADDAQFYIGETYSLDGKFDQAVEAYDKVVTNYPTGDALPGAYYKRGLALARLGQTDRARESWQTVVQQFPGTDIGNLAKQALERQPRAPSR